MAVACIQPAGAQTEKNHNLEVGKNLVIFNALYSQLDLFYVDTLNPGQTMTAGIKGMLRSLDPYTEYYPEEDAKQLEMMLTGKYAGIGALVKYHSRLKRVVVDEPYEGMPAAEVGLKKGDVILSIDDSVMTDKTVSYVSSHLRGAPGTTFVLKDWQEFKQRVISSGFTYDDLSRKQFDELVKTAKFEGYYDDAREAFDALSARLHHDLGSELDRHRETIQQMIEMDIIGAYHYQRGTMEAGLGYDKQLLRAVELLKHPDEYRRVLQP